MPSTNGSKRAVLYARVSTDEQARSGYSLAQQFDALRDYAVREGYEVLAEIQDAGHSGATLERPGIDEVRDLVAAGGVSFVLAQDRDRFSREPAYAYLLRQEFEEHGTRLRSLNDSGSDSPEGQLTDGILDQLAKFERAKISERMRRGKMRKAREGKVLAGSRANFGFSYNDARDNYVVDEEAMAIVQRIFRMVGQEGLSLYAVRSAFDREGLQPPRGGKYWSAKTLRDCIQDDVYRAHSYEEVAALVSAEVAAKLDPDKDYGIWWYNRQRTDVRYASVAGDGGREYRKKSKVTDKPREEWIAVPIPDSGIPRSLVDAAREAIKDKKKPSSNADRVWELSGGVLFCDCCGNRMTVHTTGAYFKGKAYRYHYYRCSKRFRHGVEACPQTKHYPAMDLEGRVWNFVEGLLAEPERLRAGLDEMIELERSKGRGDPSRELVTWTAKIAETDSKRSGFQDMAAEGLITLDELRSKLDSLKETRRVAETEIEKLRESASRIEGLEADKDTLLAQYSDLMPEALRDLEPDERQSVYNMLRLRIHIDEIGEMVAEGVLGGHTVFCENGTESVRTSSCKSRE